MTEVASAQGSGPWWVPTICFLMISMLLACASPPGEEGLVKGEICEVSFALTQGSGPEIGSAGQPLSTIDISLSRWGPERIFPGGHVYVLGQQLDAGAGQGRVPLLEIRGSLSTSMGSHLKVETVLQGEVMDQGQRAEFRLSSDELAAWGAGEEEGAFNGQAVLVIQPGSPREAVELPFNLSFQLVPRLHPTLERISIASPRYKPVDVYPEDLLVLDAQDLLLGAEGQVELVLDGESRRGDAAPRSERYILPVEALLDRDEGLLRFGAAGFGILPGSFVGKAWLMEQTEDGPRWESNAIDLELRIQPPLLSGFDPQAASRGQWIGIQGRGFLPPSENGATLLRLDGTFHPSDGSPDEPLVDYALSPDEFLDNGHLRYALRSQIEIVDHERVLVGLAAKPGRFSGTITPIITWDKVEVAGPAYRGGFDIAPTKQVVYLKYLPGFTVSLRATWGLKNVEREVRRRIMDVCTRDYTGINVEFTDQRPRDFHEYVILEVGGFDPNGRDLFGLDNTTGPEGDLTKDVGNLRLHEIIGGRNARAEEQGFLAYGGVFLESFRQFSTWLPETISIASPRFEDIFMDMAPFLCGEAVEPDEYPDGPRAEEIAEAIRVLGNFIGSTISHEIGHSVGLSLPCGGPYEFHNLFDTPNAMMDTGRDRPFEERAEIDGQGPAVFNTENRGYLETILPLP